MGHVLVAKGDRNKKNGRNDNESSEKFEFFLQIFSNQIYFNTFVFTAQHNRSAIRKIICIKFRQEQNKSQREKKIKTKCCSTA